MASDYDPSSDGPTDEPNETDETAGSKPTDQTQSETHHQSGRGSRALTEILNEATPGLLRLAFTSRDVTIAVDGDATLRLVAVFRSGRGDGLDDLFDPTETSALGGWMALDLSQVMLVEWQPGPDAHEAMVREVRTRLGDAAGWTKD